MADRRLADRRPTARRRDRGVGGMLPRHYVSAGAAAMPIDSHGVALDMSHI
jgi:hypothetical protein